MTAWKRNLTFLWISQLLSLVGFAFALPFAPFYLQELGITGTERLRLWSGYFMALGGIPLAIASPLWGMLADRVGRKPMTLRANLAGSLVLMGMALVRSPGQLLVLRVLQGTFTGTVSANMALAVASTPENRSGMVVGFMNAAVFTGNALGPLVGGVIADHFGYRTSFLLSGLSLGLAFLIVLLFVREDFQPAPPRAPQPLTRRMARFFHSGGLFQLMGLIMLMGFSRFMPRPLYPLLVREVAAPGLGIATQAGMVNGTEGVAAVLAGVAIGLVSDRMRVLVLGMLSAIMAGIFLAPQGLVGVVWHLFPLVFCSAFAAAGIDSVLSVVLARRVPPERRGTAFGLAGSAKSAGWSLGALGGGYLAAYAGFPATFAVNGLLFLVLAVLLGLLSRSPDPDPQP